MIIAVVGSGGKTTLIKRYKEEYLSQGLKVLVMTSTHMAAEEDSLMTDDADEIIRMLEEKHYTMAGYRENGKFSALSRETYQTVCTHADVVLIEADGSNRKPVKFPAYYEPVIYENVDRIVVVCGLHALNRRLADVSHRPELVKRALCEESNGADMIDDDTIINAVHIQTLVRRGYTEPLKAKYPDKEILIEPSHNGGFYQSCVAELIRQDIDVPPAKKTGCVIMASGLSRRFGSNKLLAEFRGRTLIQTVLDVTGGELFAKRVVVTRSREVKELCEAQGVNVIFHHLPGRNDAVRLGTEHMTDMDGLLFCPCDQPLLTRESLQEMTGAFSIDEEKIYRLSCGEKVGAPVLFGRKYFAELRRLPVKRGGSYLAEQYADRVQRIEARDRMEIYDVDTPEELAYAEDAAEKRPEK